MPKLFSYGTLQQDNVQMATFGRLLQGTTDTLVGYHITQIYIDDEDVVAKSGKRYHPILVQTHDPRDTVDGTVYEISDAELTQADAYEVDAYVRVAARFASGQTAWIYADAKQVSDI